MDENILLIDDEPNILESMHRQLRKRFKVVAVENGDEALVALKSKGPFAVIVSDMRMPGMDGVQLLSRVKDSFPDTVRIMLTGNADQETATKAVNTGGIFRFLTKPCSTALLVTSLALAVRHYNLLTAEKELLNKTVKGSIAMMSELLSLSNYTAFSRGYRIKPLVKQIAEDLKLPDLWQYEVAALMSQIGCITVPSDILHKLYAGTSLSEEEQQVYENHPKVGSRLIRKIPRLEKVAAIIENQLRHLDCCDKQESQEEEVYFGTEILKTTIEYDLLRQQNLAHLQAIKRMRKQSEKYNSKVLDLLEKHEPRDERTTIKNLNFKDIILGMMVEQDVFAKNGVMLIPKGQEITWPVMQSLKNFEKLIGIIQPIRVSIAKREEC